MTFRASALMEALHGFARFLDLHCLNNVIASTVSIYF